MQARLTILLLLAACAPAVVPADVSISSLDFGAVEPAHVHHATLHVSNRGPTTRLIDVAREGGSERITVTPGQRVLAVGETVTWNVTLTSGDVGELEAHFIAHFEGGDARFTVRALVAGPCDVDALDLGDARVGSTNARVISVHNPRAVPAAVYVGSPAAPFSAVPSGTLRLAPGESHEVRVSFAPTEAGSAGTSWLVATRTDCTAASAQLQGRGVTAPLVVSPGRLHFGIVPVGEARTRTVEVQNLTRTALHLSEATLGSTVFSLATPLPVEVPPEGRVTLTLRARPPSSAEASTSLVLTTDAPHQPELELPLLVNRAQPCLVASHQRVDFGAVETGCTSDGTTLIFTNECLHAVRWSEPRVPERFGLISSADSMVLAPGAQARFRVIAAPTTAGVASGPFELEADVLDGAETARVALSAEVLPAPRLEETVVTASAPRVDVLFVLDDSPRMLPLAQSVESNLENIALYLGYSGLSARVAVMGTAVEVGEVGRLRRAQSGAAWIDDPSPLALTSLAAVRGEATGRSSCLEALASAFTSPLREDPTELGGFLRPQTPLYVVCITNGRDELRQPLSEMLATLQRTLPPKRMVAVVARFLGEQCAGSLEHGPLRVFASVHNGAVEEICTDRWSIALERIGTTGHYVPLIPFTGEVDPQRGPLQLFLDDVEIPEFAPYQVWSWNSFLRAVQFNPVDHPPPGTRVTLRYTPACPVR